MPPKLTYQVSTASQYIGRHHIPKHSSFAPRRPSSAKSVHFSDTDTIITSPSLSGTDTVDFAFADFTRTSGKSWHEEHGSPRSKRSHDSLTALKLEGRTPSRLDTVNPDIEEGSEEGENVSEFSFFDGREVLTVLSPTTYSPVRPKTRGKGDESFAMPTLLIGEGTQYPRLPPVIESPSTSPTISSPQRPKPRGKGDEKYSPPPLMGEGTQYPRLPSANGLPSTSSTSSSPTCLTTRDTRSSYDRYPPVPSSLLYEAEPCSLSSPSFISDSLRPAISPTTTSPTRPQIRGKIPDISLTPPSFTEEETQSSRLPPLTVNHSPSSSAGSEKIYFSPIVSTQDSKVWLSSPQPSPPRTPDEGVVEEEVAEPMSLEEKKEEVIAVGSVMMPASIPSESPEESVEAVHVVDVGLLPPASSGLQHIHEIGGDGRNVKGEKVTLTLEQVDKLATALAASPIVQEAVNGKALVSTEDGLGEPVLPLPVSENGAGGVAIVGDNGRIMTTSSHEALKPRTPVVNPHREIATASLQVLPSTHISGESRVLLQTHMPLVCVSGKPRALLAETDLTISFASAALHELAAAIDLSLDDIEIATPLASQSTESFIDWGALADEFAAHERLGDAIYLCLERFKSMSKEDCTMRTLTLLSELGRVKRTVGDALVVKPLPGRPTVVPFISQALNAKFVKTEAKNKFIDAVVALIEPRFKGGEEFDVYTEFSSDKRMVRLRCVPVTREQGPEARVDWVCFVVREFF